MKLACDTDYLVKVEHWNIAEPILAILGTTRGESYRLAAAPHQLRRGPIRKRLGDAEADRILPLVNQYRVFDDDASAEWLDRMKGCSGIDGGEAELYARAAASDTLVLASGDKRSMKMIGSVPGLSQALEGKLVTLESSLIRMCIAHGTEAVRRHVCEIVKGHPMVDRMAAIVFSASSTDESVWQGLWSYFESCRQDGGTPSVFFDPQA